MSSGGAGRRRAFRTVLFALLAAAAVLLIAYQTPNPGVTIKFELYEDGVGETDLLARPDVAAVAFVRAITPDGEVPVYMVSTNGFVHIPASALAGAAKNWTDLLRARGHDPADFFTALIVSLVVVNRTNGELLWHVVYFLDYQPAKIARGDTELIYTLHVVKGRGEKRGYVARVDREEKRPLVPGAGGALHAAFGPPYGEPPREVWCEYVPSATSFCWYRKAWVGVDNLTEVFPSSYFSTFDGKLYVKTPVLIAVNNSTYSGTVDFSIMILPATSRLAVGAAVAAPGEHGPSISLAGWSWGGQRYYLADALALGPTTSGWIWIWGRPVFTSYDIWYYTGTHSYYEGEEDYFYIADIYVSGTTVVSGLSFGLPQEIINFFYGGINKQQLVIPDMALADGKLDPGETFQLGQIFPYFDKCGADFEVGVPIGAVAAAVLAKSPIQLALSKAAIPGVEVSLSVQGANIYVFGSIHNYGDHPGIPTDHDVPEFIYVAVGKYNYTARDIWGNTCLYQVPAGLYVESR